MIRNIEYFKVAKELNKKFHSDLIKKKLHFRGNENSFSLISVAKETAEKGKSGFKTKKRAEQVLKNGLDITKPKRETPEKELQAWIINYSMNNKWELPFDKDIKYLTSEIALKVGNKKIVNDILAIDKYGALCIIELKSKRDNYVKQQTINFEAFVMSERTFFEELLESISPIKWNGKIRKIAIWPKAEGKTRTIKEGFEKVEEINYSTNEEKTEYKFE